MNIKIELIENEITKTEEIFIKEEKEGLNLESSGIEVERNLGPQVGVNFSLVSRAKHHKGSIKTSFIPAHSRAFVFCSTVQSHISDFYSFQVLTLSPVRTSLFVAVFFLH